MNKDVNFLKEINETLANLLSQVLFEQPNSFQFFKKPQKVLADQPTANSPDFHMWIYDMFTEDERVITFNSEDKNGDYLVYRQPVITTFRLCLSCSKMSFQEKLSSMEKINSYFFDNKIMKPIVPAELKNVAPPIFEKLSNSDAFLNMIKENTNHLDEGLTFKFEYKALYHSGSPLRVEKKVQTRKMDIQQR